MQYPTESDLLLDVPSFSNLFYLILSYLILSYLILSYLILSYLILAHLILSYLILSYLILSHLLMSLNRRYDRKRRPQAEICWVTVP